ncbi:MAG TPA: sulfatase [Phycisphaerae bacterium]|nr:sulfatase [Phycisphaerae bacterium]
MPSTTRRRFLGTIGLGAAACAVRPAWLAAAPAPAKKPNFLLVFTDDQGYGDLSCYGSKTIHTPRLDQMAREGLKLTSFYVQPVCGPSRAALMTGCYPSRVIPARAIREWSLAGSEITMAEVLKSAGYATGCIGKWDLSGRKFVEGRLPTDQGFDYYFGTLGATDSGHVAFYRNKERAGETDDMGSLTGRYTDEAIAFIRQHKDEPFLLYLPHSMPHVKIGASEQFRGKSKGGLYGDVIEELDWNTGRLLDAIQELGLAENTIVLFTSDNGPWLTKGKMGGSAGPLRDGKTTAWEGGFRVPCILWGPGRVPAGRESNELVASIDLMPTFARMAGAQAPTDRVIDGCDQGALLTGASDKSARDTFLYYTENLLRAVRKGRWKLFVNKGASKNAPAQDKSELYDLEADLGETTNVAAAHPDVVRQLSELAAKAIEDIGEGNRPGKNARLDADVLKTLQEKAKPKQKQP